MGTGAAQLRNLFGKGSIIKEDAIIKRNVECRDDIHKESLRGNADPEFQTAFFGFPELQDSSLQRSLWKGF